MKAAATRASGDPIVIAVDGGGSKTDAVALGLDGALLTMAHGTGSSPQIIGVDGAVRVVDALVNELLEACGGPSVLQAGVYLSGLDLPVEVATFRTALEPLPWTRGGRPFVADNDMFALLRAGTEEPDAVAVVCGTGINCIGVRADGEQARFDALGTISGDWGGGTFLGEQALWHAARAIDGRGGPTVFTTSIPAHFGLEDVQTVIEAFHFGRLPGHRFSELAPLVLAAADGGDSAAFAILDRQAEEIVSMAVSAITRLGLGDTPLPLVLGGGVLAAANRRLIDGIETGLAARAPRVRVHLVRARPIVGAALLALESAGAASEALARAQAAVADRLSLPQGDAKGDEAAT
ncbi:BadF/BadG/BcrA/BcrD ATPase family protein [Leifsonia bigeumensis]|uniref:BadF/BadG/BcrA/BcrD ATPase family protein n=1 Tax=Leifsonella bigeumensis TaxID=433643 RepID=A0ABP7FLN1_9MICO